MIQDEIPPSKPLQRLILLLPACKGMNAKRMPNKSFHRIADKSGARQTSRYAACVICYLAFIALSRAKFNISSASQNKKPMPFSAWAFLFPLPRPPRSGITFLPSASDISNKINPAQFFHYITLTKRGIFLGRRKTLLS